MILLKQTMKEFKMCNHANEKCDKGRPDYWSVDMFYEDSDDTDGPPDRRIVSDSVPSRMRSYLRRKRVTVIAVTASQAVD